MTVERPSLTDIAAEASRLHERGFTGGDVRCVASLLDQQKAPRRQIGFAHDDSQMKEPK